MLQGGFDLGIIDIEVGLVGRFGEAHGVEVHFDGAEMAETPGIPSDGIGQFLLLDGLGVQFGDVFGF